jgi:hypothetical protein
MNTTIRTNAIRILEENYEQTEQNETLREYVERSADSDPGFFRWLFDEDLRNDFDTSLSDEQRAAWEEFRESL